MAEENKKNLKIVFVIQSAGYLAVDIINEFADNYDKVALIAGNIRLQDVRLKEKVKWLKIIKYNRGSPVKKLISWLVGTLQIFFLLVSRFRKYEIFYWTVPPLAYLLSLILPNKFSVIIMDVYPDVLKIYKVKESNILYRFWQKWNRKLFSKAHQVFTIGEGMAKLLESYITRERITIIPLWTGLIKAAPVDKNDNPWLNNRGIEDKFIIQYSGNIGYTHNVEIIVELANRMKEFNGYYFLIIGRGEKVKKIQDLIKKYKLSNCEILPFQPDEVLVYSLAAADLGVVILDEKVAHVSLPSKIYNIQAVGVPILAISPPDTELASHIKKYKNGMCFRQDELDEIVQFIEELKNDKKMLQHFSNNSKKAAADFTSENAKQYFNSYVTCNKKPDN
ncbi:MAG: glycosyltransferase family 4 protein [Clostridiaceae bacterium]|nr:glycosyltransferase family 4 protein [Clostridiaceae bacterium]